MLLLGSNITKSLTDMSATLTTLTSPTMMLLEQPDAKDGLNPAVAYLASLHSTTSRVSMKSKLDTVARMVGFADLRDCDWGHLRAEHVLALMTRLENEGRKANTVNCYLAALKGVAKAGWQLRLIDQDTLLRIQAIKQRRFHRLPTGRSISKDEGKSILNHCRSRHDAIGRRDLAILSLMLGCGLRRGEIPGLRLEHYDRNEGSLRVVGKGDKERRVFLPPAVQGALEAWLQEDRGKSAGWLFGRIYKNGRLETERPLDARSIGDILKNHLQNQAPLTAHDLRRTFATRLLAANVDIVTVQKMMGHASVTTTAQYDRRGDEAQRNIAQSLQIE